VGKSRADQFREHIEGLPEDKRREALATTMGQIYLAAEGVSQQAQRLRASHSVTHTEHQNDALFFVVALHLLIRLLELAVQLADDTRRPGVQVGLERLMAAAGHVQGARDVLAHLDEYLTGFGKAHEEAGLRPLPWFSREGTRYTVRIGDYEVDVDVAADAAMEAFSTALPLWTAEAQA
jgi:hypothetical protein